ncbi:nucleoside triphosphate pyrophosphohydrolase [Halobacillus sp. Nhm2S1]|uniref:nucleoside triphosphate pyrophosphohydrolase n=1 Tax=Halobacillus sp. Nhm2S1 TaxID=2866716 RepID=UPI001C7359EF|nr:nucleoside triphosphate pyrophosphohydrolase [Halobacillus sp. Nhm2S1]MBX0358358.1 nucleoside triphosphate pyrophosphohydrolase [Halobacillus sp. Nhm2S1]
MPVYNKLVRDLIPKIIEDQGKFLKTKILSDEAFRKELRTKLKEEMNEYLEADNDKDAVEELADLLELMNALAKQHGSSIQEVEEIRKRKAEKRGAFEEKVFLVHVEE